MKNKHKDFSKLLKTTLAMLIIAFLCLTMFTACSSASADAKNANAKKLKAKREAALEDEEAESDSESLSDTNTNSSNTDKKLITEKSDTEENKNPTIKKEDKKEDKKADKTVSEKDKTKSEEKVSAETIWADLMKGNKRFMAGNHTSVNFTSSRKMLIKEQKPRVIVLGCADSRVPPEFIFDKNLGELFVVRDAGNIADAVSLGSIEYAIEHLHSKMIVVLGHESCGAVAATVSGKEMPSKNLRAITESIAPALEGSKTCLIGGESNLSCIELNAEHSAAELLLKSSIIKEAVESGEVTIISAVYHLETGQVERLK
jgi:carbonic anhydrase